MLSPKQNITSVPKQNWTEMIATIFEKPLNYQIAKKHVTRVGGQGRSDQVDGNKQSNNIVLSQIMWPQYLLCAFDNIPPAKWEKNIFCFIHLTAGGK